jgi:hypothetical protein
VLCGKPIYYCLSDVELDYRLGNISLELLKVLLRLHLAGTIVADE